MRVIFCDDDSIILEQLHLYVSEYFSPQSGQRFIAMGGLLILC